MPRALLACSAITILASHACASVTFDAQLSTQLWMNARDAQSRGGWLDIQALPTALALSSVVDLDGGSPGWIAPGTSSARRTPDRPDASLFESTLNLSGMISSTSDWALMSGRLSATQPILFTDTRTDATTDTLVRFDLYVSWWVAAGSDDALDGRASAAAGWNAWQSDPSGPVAESTAEHSASPASGTRGNSGLWSYSFNVTVPAGSSTTFEFTTFVEGYGESAAVPTSGTAGLFCIGLLIAGSRRRG
jgi:hypothetical protein